MEATELKLEYECADKALGGIPVIIVAAGSATRMNGINKQFMPLLGIPVIIRTLLKFERSDSISKIIVVTKKESINELELLAQKYMISKLTDIVEGGENRHASVMKGMDMLCDGDKKVLIHDGARPFVSEKMISECAEALQEYDGALCAIKINDTVKLCDENGFVTGTLDRSHLYAAQTPQGVDVALYRAICAERDDVCDLTDDAAVLEVGGHTVKIIEGSAHNIKITSPQDIALAETITKDENL